MTVEPPNGRGGPQIIPRPDNSRPGGHPPWNHLTERTIDLSLLVSRLEIYEPVFHDRQLPSTGRTSAVLIALYMRSDGEPMVVLTRRSPQLRAHTHEVAFPGGRHDEIDADHVETALREAEEEVGLDRSLVRIVGALDWFVTGGSGSLVYPFVGVLEEPPRELVANPDEVEQILHVSLNELLLDEVWREEIWTRDGVTAPITFFELHGDTVWGATANMLRQLLTIATDYS